jgi:glycosyltransferase involved in cell wall biosynthesis
MRVCYFGTYRSQYARNQILIEGLRRAGVEVLECHESLWIDDSDRVKTAEGGWFHPSFWWRVLRTYYRLLVQYRHIKTYDILVVGYPGHFDIFLARLLSWWRRTPLVWDVLNSLYLIILERGIHKSHPLTGQIIRIVEKIACQLPDMMILDTKQFIDWFQKTHNVNSRKFRLVQIGADDRLFQPIDNISSSDDPFDVIYYGSYIPNHGVSYIIQAAAILADDPNIRFTMIGDGPEQPIAKTLSHKFNLNNVQFLDWMDHKELINQIARANLVLGVFGTTQQLLLTNNNKIYEAFAMRKPVISGNSPALPLMLINREHLYLCERGNPDSLAEGISTLKNDPLLCQKLAYNGHQIFHQYFDIDHIGAKFAGHLAEVQKNQ